MLLLDILELDVTLAEIVAVEDTSVAVIVALADSFPKNDEMIVDESDNRPGDDKEAIPVCVIVAELKLSKDEDGNAEDILEDEGDEEGAVADDGSEDVDVTLRHRHIQ